MNDTSNLKVVCEECGWQGLFKDMLYGHNPFRPEQEISVCPDCKEINNTCVVACDEPECWEEVSCGTPVPNGYRSTCYKHMPGRKT